ncbi:MAG: hypothetical protein ABI831_13055 [Betaproteobacteria bacterium]
MLPDNSRKLRLMREALGNDEGRLPTAASTIKTMGVIAFCLAVIGVSASSLPEKPVMVAGTAHAHAGAVSVATPANGERDESGKNESARNGADISY